MTKLVWRGGEPSQCITSHGLPPSACSCVFKKPGFFCVTIYSKSNAKKQSSWSAFRLPSSTPLFGSWKVPHLCPSVDTQVLVSSMWVPPTWVGNPSRMLGCSDGLKSMPPARRNGGCWKVFFFFRFFKEMQVIWLVDLQWNMLVPRCIEPCRVVWTCQVNLDTHLLDPSTTNTVHSWASARCQCWGWQFCCLRKTQPDLGNFHWQGRGGHLGPSVWQVRLLGVGQSEAMDCQFGTGRNSTRSSYPWLKGAVFLVPWKTTSCPK